MIKNNLNVLLLVSSIFLVFSRFIFAQTTLPPNGYSLIWNDEFNGNTLDLTKWAYRYTDKYITIDTLKNGMVVYVNHSPKSVSLNGAGLLSIKTFLSNDTLYTGMIATQNLFEQKYGYFEARVKFEKLQGHHGSFWLQSPTYGNPINDPATAGTEIDDIEFFGSGRSDRGATCGVYWNPYSKPAHVGTTINLTPIIGPSPAELCDDFHKFGLLWTDSAYTYYIDGHQVFTTNLGISKRTEYLLLSLSCSSWEAPRLDPNLLPDSMIVDYVRVYAPSSVSDVQISNNKIYNYRLGNYPNPFNQVP